MEVGVERLIRRYENQIIELNRNNIILTLEKEDLLGEITHLKDIINELSKPILIPEVKDE